MPIYAYCCEECSFAKDVLQKMSDEPLTLCPACNKESFKKQVTAAGFQLKGSGWYVTDFRGGDTAKTAKSGDADNATSSSSSTNTNAANTNTASEATSPTASTASTTSATPPAPASGAA
ncbi:MAG: zinc ribbon domain-containing protein [Undibacterium sp.]|nr:zinc ribbon domain-containing protein [Undibacterium sp.]